MLTSSVLGDVYLLAVVALIAWHARACALRGRFFVLDPLNAFWAGVLVCYVWQPVVHHESLVSWRGMEVIEKTLLMSVLAVLGVIIGYESRLGRGLVGFIPAMYSRLRPERLAAASFVLIGVGLAGYAYLVASAGGWSAWLSVGRGATNWEEVSGYLAQAHNLLPVGVGLWLFHVELHGTRGPRRAIAWAVGAAQWSWFVYLGTRSRTIVFALLMLAAYYLPRRRNPPLLLVPLAMAALLVLVQFQGAYRSHFTDLTIFGNLDLQEVKTSAPNWFLKGSSRSGDVSTGLEFNCAAAAVELVPERVDYNFGYPHLELFTRPIPRAVWPDKIYPALRAYTPLLREANISSTPIRTASENLLGGPAFTFIGHWYAVGGSVAVLLAAVLTGAVFRGLRGVYDRRPDSEGDMVLYAALMPIGFNECVSEPLAFLFTLPFTLLPLVLVLRLCRAGAHARGAAP